MRQRLTERYRERLAGVLSCYDRIVITGTLPGAGGLIGAGHYLLLVAPSSRSTSRWRHEERASRASNARIS